MVLKRKQLRNEIHVLKTKTSTKFVQKLRELNKGKRIKNPYEAMQGNMGLYEIIPDHKGPCRIIQSIQDHMG